MRLRPRLNSGGEEAVASACELMARGIRETVPLVAVAMRTSQIDMGSEVVATLPASRELRSLARGQPGVCTVAHLFNWAVFLLVATGLVISFVDVSFLNLSNVSGGS